MSAGTHQIVRLTDTLPDDFEALREEAAAENYAFLDRLAAEVRHGDYATEADLPVLLGAFCDGAFAAVGGITRDPYDPAPDLLRLRHVYVRPGFRGRGLGGVIASALIQQGFALAPRLSLRAADERAARFWDQQGFARDDSDAIRSHIAHRQGGA